MEMNGMSPTNYSHLIEIDEQERLLTIYRISGAERQLYTSVKLPDGECATNSVAFEEFCRTLGENILFDSPQARKLLDL